MRNPKNAITEEEEDYAMRRAALGERLSFTGDEFVEAPAIKELPALTGTVSLFGRVGARSQRQIKQRVACEYMTCP